MNSTKNINNEDIEIQCLISAITTKYDYDFSEYSPAHTKRRIKHFLSVANVDNVAELLHAVLEDKGLFDQFLLNLSINVTEMFRDPAFYRAVRTKAIPLLKTYPIVKIWHAGCSTGEEVYSMAILLQEENLYRKAQIYATDFNQMVLKKAKEGIFSIEDIKNYTRNYTKAGGCKSFSDYYTAKYNSVIMDKSLKEKVVFSDHNLTLDSSFGEMNMIICRNVMIYFNKNLQNKVLALFYESLCKGGILCLGSKESIKFSDFDDKFDPIDSENRIFKKKYHL